MPHTVRGATGLVDGDANDAKAEPACARDDGHGGDDDVNPESIDDETSSGPSVAANGWGFAAVELSGERAGRLRRAAAQRLSSSSFSARTRSFSSRASFSRFLVRRRPISPKSHLEPQH